VLATSGGIEIDDNGTVTGSRFEGNAIEATGPNAVEAGGAGIDAEPLDGEAITVGDTLVRGNVLVARAGGTVTAHGAGIRNGGPLILGDVTVERNALVALGADGSAQGGGVWNGALDFDGAPPAPALTLRRTTIRRNTIRASAGVTVQGAGLFTDSPVTKADARIRDNVPDDCFGCP
jgi:hypothetical protein